MKDARIITGIFARHALDKTVWQGVCFMRVENISPAVRAGLSPTASLMLLGRTKHAMVNAGRNVGHLTELEMKATLFVVAFVCACRLATSADPPAPPAPSEERIRELVKKLETPTRKQGDQKPGPPDYPWDPFDYKWHGLEINELIRAGDAAVPHLLTLLNDKTKPGQARGFAVAVLVHRLVGPKTKPDPKIIGAINDALKEKDVALRHGVLDKLASQGLAGSQRRWESIKNEPEIKNARPPVLPPEERSFNAEVMDAFLPAIVPVLADERREICWQAAWAISEFGRPKFGIPELLDFFKQPESWKRTVGAGVLSRIATDDPDALRAVLNEFDQGKCDPKDKYYQESIIESVGRFGPKAKPAVEKLAALVKKPSRARRPRYLSQYPRRCGKSLGTNRPRCEGGCARVARLSRTQNLLGRTGRLLHRLAASCPERTRQDRSQSR